MWSGSERKVIRANFATWFPSLCEPLPVRSRPAEVQKGDTIFESSVQHAAPSWAACAWRIRMRLIAVVDVSFNLLHNWQLQVLPPPACVWPQQFRFAVGTTLGKVFSLCRSRTILMSFILALCSCAARDRWKIEKRKVKPPPFTSPPPKTLTPPTPLPQQVVGSSGTLSGSGQTPMFDPVCCNNISLSFNHFAHVL